MTLQTLDQRQDKKAITAVSVRFQSVRVAQTYGTSNANSTRMERLVFTFSTCGVSYVTALPWLQCQNLESEDN